MKLVCPLIKNKFLGAHKKYIRRDSELENEKRQLTYLNTRWFMTTLLDRKDRMSMGASLEVRVPFAIIESWSIYIIFLGK